ncbi:hypothetical protein [Pseudoalteromonas luteoviolacea]|uniref:Outer membrane protein beta-barrel domain-containing protein n=1 Tax=Pseudoalteromonas luteoviolacea DSM 6061 TaxID=1365250 RepID=A0A166VSI9_9GAMM|nr:hypothetical protein [Pseudoalteromonas luteoviolacea]KZN33652.1 hypothetical protein N475_19965 [Pseudoalteromonas luteoviolacea DSM 6061]KZN53744.1 hypothetical protein N474_19425 [Pseudoalteromonas luteoviolacea CPMOR-2]MBE0389562.1 hypothetical protein [Pseudoalteromonas luteoviolacea DSM 6061]TQF67791.1 hypothetical protein FLM44_21675 [Pseudoalteromonas luteoviolacea]
MKQSILALSVALLCSNAMANDVINFDYIGAGYAEFKAANSNVTDSFDGFAIEASTQLNEKWVVSGLYSDTSFDEQYTRINQYSNAVHKLTGNKGYDATQWELGISYLVPVEQNAVIELTGFVGRFEFEGTNKGSGQFKVNGYSPEITVFDTKATSHNRTYGLQANYHYAFSDTVSGVAGVGYQHINDIGSENKFSYQLGLQYKIIEDFTISALFSDSDAYENRQITLRYNF